MTNDTHHTACCSSSFYFIDDNGVKKVRCPACNMLGAELVPKNIEINVHEDIKLTEHLAG